MNAEREIGSLIEDGRGGPGRLLRHTLHDVAIEIECRSEAADAILRQYLGYLEGASGDDPVATLRFRVAEASREEIERATSRYRTGQPRSTAGLELWRDAEWGIASAPGEALCVAALPTRQADIVLSPAGASDPFLVRDLLSVFLVEMLRRMGRYPLHSSAGVLGSEGVVVLGPPGAGKTTLALGMARAGLAIATDDWLLYRARGDGIEAQPLIRCISLPCDQVPDPSRYTVLAYHRELPVGKYIVTRDSVSPPCPRTFRPRVVVQVLRHGGDLSEVEEASAGALLAPALTQSALGSGDEVSIRNQLAALRQLLEGCICLRLHAGLDIGRDPSVGGRLLRRWLEAGSGAGS